MSVGTRPGRTCAWSHTASSGGAGLRALSVAGSDTASAREKVTRGHVRQAAAKEGYVGLLVNERAGLELRDVLSRGIGRSPSAPDS